MSSEQNSQVSDYQTQPPPDPPFEPDRDTKKHPGFDKGGGPGQVFHFQKWGISYGTDDKGHAAALILSFFLLCFMALLFLLWSVVNIFNDVSGQSWISDALKIFGPIFTLVVGVAIGKGR